MLRGEESSRDLGFDLKSLEGYGVESLLPTYEFGRWLFSCGRGACWRRSPSFASATLSRISVVTFWDEDWRGTIIRVLGLKGGRLLTY